MRKTIYSLPDLAQLMCACNRRYLDFLSTVDDPTNWIKRVDKISRPVKEAGRSYRGFNLFSPDDEAVFHAIHKAACKVSGSATAPFASYLVRLPAKYRGFSNVFATTG